MPARNPDNLNNPPELPDFSQKLEEIPSMEETMLAVYGPAGPKLSNRMRMFVECYLISWNAHKAAKKAGYARPDITGYQLLHVPEIARAIAYRLEHAAITANEVIAQMADIARGDISDFLDPQTLEPQLIDPNTGTWKDGTNLIKKVSSTKDGTSIETYSRLEALEKLGKVLGMFVDRRENRNLNVHISAETYQQLQAQAALDVQDFERELLAEGPVQASHSLSQPLTGIEQNTPVHEDKTPVHDTDSASTRNERPQDEEDW